MPSYVFYALGAIAFIVALLASIGLHELGHFIPARRFGAKVTQYFIGFGPTIWSKQRGETEWGIKAIPLGGYVKIIGMIPPHEEKAEEGKLKIRDSNTGIFTGLIANAKKMEYETIEEADHARLFYRLPWWKKLIVMGGGPSVNIVLAFLCFFGVFAFMGERVYEVPPGPAQIAYAVQCVDPETSATTLLNSSGSCDDGVLAPAGEAGLQSGDKITSVNGDPVESWEQLVSTVQNSTGSLALEIDRDGEIIETVLEPKMVLNEETGRRAPYMGIAPVTVQTYETRGPLFTAEFMADRTWDTLVALKDIPPKLYNVFLAISGLEERDPEGPVSLVGGARFSGEIASYESGSIPGLEISSEEKVAAFFMLVGSFNLFLGVFNFLPILPLDGGHMAGAAWEGVKRGFARLFKRGEVKPVDVSKMLPIAYGFGIALFMMGILLIVGDILVPIRLLG